MFINNKYLKHYNLLIEKAKNQQREKIKGDDHQFHHVIPRSLGGSDDLDNIVMLTYKEHKLAHHLLIKITEGQSKHKMMWAYKFFDKDFYVPSPGWTKEKHLKGVQTRKRKGSYKTGKENIFASDKVKNIVKQRMKENNPMFKQDVKEKYLKNRPHSNHVITPRGYYYSLRAAAREYNLSDFEMKKLVLSCTDGSFIFLKAADRHAKETLLLPNSVFHS
jgi:hypothetical protein